VWEVARLYGRTEGYLEAGRVSGMLDAGRLCGRPGSQVGGWKFVYCMGRPEA